MLKIAPGFARLLATENIAVHVSAQASTAMFDVKSRTLTMPNWDCSERMKDMLIGHECAHAIFTDCTDIPSLLKSVFGSENMVAKDYLNVVEDIRIDRLIQRKYAGLRRDYRAGYSEMRTRDFFRLNGKDPNALTLIDRMNLHFKGFHGEIRFSQEEMIFVKRAENTETFDEVCTLAREIYDWCMENEETQEISTTTPDIVDIGIGVGDDAEGEDGEGDDEIVVSGRRGPGESSDDDSDGPGTGEGEGEEGEDGTSTNDIGESMDDDTDDGDSAESTTGSSNDDAADENDSDDPSETTGKGYTKEFAPASAKTQRAMDESVQNEAKIAADTYYGRSASTDLPRMEDINLDQIIVPFSEILNSKSYAGSPDEKVKGQEDVWNEFQSGAKATVTNLAQMFERKKAAAVNARTQVAKTGRLDMTNLHKYKMTEDIFLRNQIEVKGKNHGIVVYVDWSGSMDVCIEETIAQTAVLAMFCKKVGIPFRIYAFSTWVGDDRDEKTYRRGQWGGNVNQHAYEGEEGYDPRGMTLGNFTLLELFSDKMKKAEFDHMGSLLMAVPNYEYRYKLPRCLHLGGTPLNESIVAAIKVAGQFRRANNIDVLNTIWITDGGDGNPFSHGQGIVQNRETGRTWSYSNDSTTARGTDLLLRIYKDHAGGNLIGIFLADKKNITRQIYYQLTDGNGAKMEKDFAKNSFVEYPHAGYDTYFLMDKKIAVYTGSDKLEELPENASTTRVINAFRKDLSKRTMSRPLLNTFTDKIAKEIV